MEQDKKKCKECWHFKPYWTDGWHLSSDAYCNHPDCYETVKKQNCFGDIYNSKERIANIIDFNPDGKCSRWTGVVKVPVKHKWWIFEWEEETKLPKKSVNI